MTGLPSASACTFDSPVPPSVQCLIFPLSFRRVDPVRDRAQSGRVHTRGAHGLPVRNLDGEHRPAQARPDDSGARVHLRRRFRARMGPAVEVFLVGAAGPIRTRSSVQSFPVAELLRTPPFTAGTMRSSGPGARPMSRSHPSLFHAVSISCSTEWTGIHFSMSVFVVFSIWNRVSYAVAATSRPRSPTGLRGVGSEAFQAPGWKTPASGNPAHFTAGFGPGGFSLDGGTNPLIRM